MLVRAFENDANFSADLIRRGAVDLALPIHDLPPVPVWHRGRVLLTGDAAHATSPSSGQGASLAIEDAIVLARCLRDSGGHEEAFRRFEAERRPRAERVVAYSRTISNSKAAGPVRPGVPRPDDADLPEEEREPGVTCLDVPLPGRPLVPRLP